jgi:hypothetical protein
MQRCLHMRQLLLLALQLQQCCVQLLLSLL